MKREMTEDSKRKATERRGRVAVVMAQNLLVVEAVTFQIPFYFILHFHSFISEISQETNFAS
jgi:hypothetical protein